MSPNKIDANDDVAAIIEAFRTQLHDPVNSLSLLARFEVAERDGEGGRSRLRAGEISDS
jgi:hypothetical protein